MNGQRVPPAGWHEARDNAYQYNAQQMTVNNYGVEPDAAGHLPGHYPHGTALAAVSVVASVVGVGTTIGSLLEEDIVLFVITIVAVLLVLGSWVLRRRTRVAIALLVVGCLTVGGSVTAGVDRWLLSADESTVDRDAAAGATGPGAPTGTPDGGTASAGEASGPAVTADPRGTGSTAGGAAGPAKLVDDSVILPRNAAVDVDEPDQEPVPDHRDGATGEYDFYHHWGQLESDTVEVVNAPNAYSYSGGSMSRAYFTCKSDLTKSPYTGMGGSGASFCFKTSRGHVGFATITQTRPDYAFVIHVIVWDGPAE